MKDGSGHGSDCDSSSGESSLGRFNKAVSTLTNVEFHDSDTGSDLSGRPRQPAGWQARAGYTQPSRPPAPRTQSKVPSQGQSSDEPPDTDSDSDFSVHPLVEKAPGLPGYKKAESIKEPLPAKHNGMHRNGREETHEQAFDQMLASSTHGNREDGGRGQQEQGESPDKLALHNSGECRPCLYHNSKRGCVNGNNCRFCHLAHGKKTRPCKAKRNECKQIADMLHTVYGEDTEEFKQAATKLSAQSPYMRTILGKPKATGRPGQRQAASIDHYADFAEIGLPWQSEQPQPAALALQSFQQRSLENVPYPQ